MQKTYDVVAIGNAIVDVLAQTNDQILATLGVNKGTMTLVDEKRAVELYRQMGLAIEMSGGSAANTAFSVSALGGKVGYIGKVADDQLGQVFRHDMRSSGVAFETPALAQDRNIPTARCLSFVTSDGERSMCTYLGACVEITTADIDLEMVKAAKVTYLEGYLFDRDSGKDAFRLAAKTALAAGQKVALTLSDPFCVERHREDFKAFISSSVSILFANQKEICALCEVDTVDEAIEKMKGQCEVLVITQGSKGARIVTATEDVLSPCAKVDKVVDTTGAGDSFAAGFLYGYTQGMTMSESADLGNRLAAIVIGAMGARPQTDIKVLLKDRSSAQCASAKSGFTP